MNKEEMEVISKLVKLSTDNTDLIYRLSNRILALEQKVKDLEFINDKKMLIQEEVL